MIEKKPENCIKCGIFLCTKNEIFVYCNKRKRTYRQNVCRSCKTNGLSCRLTYDDSKLEALSLSRYNAITTRFSRQRHIEKRKLYQNLKSLVERETLDNRYIIKSLLHSTKIKLFESVEQITPEIIEVKRKQLIVQRELKKQGIWVR